MELFKEEHVQGLTEGVGLRFSVECDFPRNVGASFGELKRVKQDEIVIRKTLDRNWQISLKIYTSLYLLPFECPAYTHLNIQH